MANRTRCLHCGEFIPGDSVTCPVCEHRFPTPDQLLAEHARDIAQLEKEGLFRSSSEFAVALFVVGGLFSHVVAALEFHFHRMESAVGIGAALLGAGLICLGLTIAAKMKHRHWAWGLLGFLGVAGCLVALLLRRGCEACGGLRRRDGVCPACAREYTVQG